MVKYASAVRPAREDNWEKKWSTYLLQVGFHNLWAVVDSQNNVSDASFGKSLNLVLDHGLVGELHEGLGESKGLEIIAS